MSGFNLIGLYGVFAAISIAANLGFQWISVNLYAGTYKVPVSMLIGTAAGLAIKYVLDKHWIFRHTTANAGKEVKTFALYAGMGIVTTAIFWCTESAFHWVFGSEAMRYLGGLIGLVIGYAVKYQLDKNLVFR